MAEDMKPIAVAVTTIESTDAHGKTQRSEVIRMSDGSYWVPGIGTLKVDPDNAEVLTLVRHEPERGAR